jgi:uncharacterized protein YjgD (DUF1641 family)
MTEAKAAGGDGAGGSAGVGDIERLMASARDAVTDDTVTRLAATVGNGLDLLDRVNRSGVGGALPTITRMVESGDLERLASLARLVGALEDSLSDDIVKRLATVATELAALVDKLARNPGFLRLIDVLGRDEVQCGLIDLAESACAAKRELAQQPAPGGGVFSVLRIASDPDTQSALLFFSQVAGQMRRRQSGPA